MMSCSDVLRLGPCSHTILEAMATGKERTPVVTCAVRSTEVAQEEETATEVILLDDDRDGGSLAILRVQSRHPGKKAFVCTVDASSFVGLPPRSGPMRRSSGRCRRISRAVRLEGIENALLHIEPTDRPSFSQCQKRSGRDTSRKQPRGLPARSQTVTIGWIEDLAGSIDRYRSGTHPRKTLCPHPDGVTMGEPPFRHPVPALWAQLQRKGSRPPPRPEDRGGQPEIEPRKPVQETANSKPKVQAGDPDPSTADLLFSRHKTSTNSSTD